MLGCAGVFPAFILLEKRIARSSPCNGTWRSQDQGVQFSKVNATAALQLWTNGSDLYGMDWNDCLTKWNGGAWSNLNYYSGTILGAHGDFAARDSVNRNLWFWSYKSSQFRVYSMNTSTAAISEKTLLTQTVTNLYGDQRGNLATMFGRFDDGTTRLLVFIDGGSNWLCRMSTMPDLYTTLYWGMDVVILPNGDILLYGGDSGFFKSRPRANLDAHGFCKFEMPKGVIAGTAWFWIGKRAIAPTVRRLLLALEQSK